MEGGKVIVPVPVPVYIPVPMAFYKVPQPYPLPIPVPIPVPYFIPTTKKNADSILKHIKVCMQYFFYDCNIHFSIEKKSIYFINWEGGLMKKYLRRW